MTTTAISVTELAQKIGAVVVGLNPDDVESHKAFCEKYSFAIDLLSGPKAQLLEKTGVGQKTFKGSLYWNRTTFLIDPKGVVQKVYISIENKSLPRLNLDAEAFAVEARQQATWRRKRDIQVM